MDKIIQFSVIYTLNYACKWATEAQTEHCFINDVTSSYILNFNEMRHEIRAI